MALVRSNRLGISGVLGALVTLGVVACGDDFSGNDCKQNHTCAATGGDSNAQAGSDGDAGSDATSPGGSSNGSGDGGNGNTQAGSGSAVECTGPEDCDNGNPDDGAETCDEGGLCAPGNPPPTVTSVSPEGDASDVEPDAVIVITFSEPLDPATVTSDNIQVLDGGVVVQGTLDHVDGEVTFTPADPLALLAGYEVKVATAVTDADGAALLAEYSSAFRTRDGVWSVVDAVTTTGDARLYQLADTLPVTADGNALVSWIAINTPGYYCPTSARWFHRGAALGSGAALLTSVDVQDCRSVAAGANAAGVGVVAWQEDLEFVRQFRAGEWSASKETVSTSGTSWRYSVGVAPDGAVSFIQQGSSSGTSAWRADSSGNWAAVADDISTEGATERGLSAARIAFDSDGNAFAAWRAQDSQSREQILVSHYTTAAGTWGRATVLPGSLASDPSADFERGAPAIAVDSEGHAMVLWVREAGATDNTGALVASRNTSGDTWSNPVVIKPTFVVRTASDAPALVFDGKTFVAGFTTKSGANYFPNTARYDMTLLQWDDIEPRTASSGHARMPQLGADAHQNLLMMWVGANDDHEPVMVVDRYNAQTGQWSGPQDLVGGIVNDANFVTGGVMPLGVNASGLGAVMWGDENMSGELNIIRLASFY